VHHPGQPTGGPELPWAPLAARSPQPPAVLIERNARVGAFRTPRPQPCPAPQPPGEQARQGAGSLRGDGWGKIKPLRPAAGRPRREGTEGAPRTPNRVAPAL